METDASINDENQALLRLLQIAREERDRYKSRLDGARDLCQEAARQLSSKERTAGVLVLIARLEAV